MNLGNTREHLVACIKAAIEKDAVFGNGRWLPPEVTYYKAHTLKVVVTRSSTRKVRYTFLVSVWRP